MCLHDFVDELPFESGEIFVELAHEVVKHVQSLVASERASFARIEVETSDQWRTLRDRAKPGVHDDALFWLEELLETL